MAMTVKNRIENKRVWQTRLARLRMHRGTIASFCRAEGISREALQYWKNQLSTELAGKPMPSTRPAFLPVEVLKAEIRPQGNGLPDPRWAAEFVRCLCGGRQ